MSEFLDVDKIIKTLLTGKSNKKGKILKKSEIEILCRKASAIFLSQPTLLELEAPLKVCGDIHGQYSDLLKLFGFGGFPPVANYLFLGDYVDRGQQSLETICLLLAYKVKYPENFFLLRGNHEVASVCRVYGFFDECKRRYNIKIFKTFTDVFNTLPVAALIDDKIFCCHGGLSPDLLHLSQISNIKRPTDIPQSGLLCDLLWSDPSPDPGWMHNDRGVSFTFGEDVVHRFLQKHNLDLICRGHMVVEDGYEFFANRRLVTVFSAPNYCGEFDNAGALMSVNDDLLCSFQILTPVKNGLGMGATNLKNSKNNKSKSKKEPPMPTDSTLEFLEAAKRLRRVNLNSDNDSSSQVKIIREIPLKNERPSSIPTTSNFTSSDEFLGKLKSLKNINRSDSYSTSSSSSLAQNKKLSRSTEDLITINSQRGAEFLGAVKLRKVQEAPETRSHNYFEKNKTPEFLNKSRGLRRVQSARISDASLSSSSSPQSGVFRSNTSREDFDKHVEETITKVKHMAEVYQKSQKRF